MNHAHSQLRNTTRRAVLALAVFAVSASTAIAGDKLQITHAMGRTDVAETGAATIYLLTYGSKLHAPVYGALRIVRPSPQRQTLNCAT